ncbi:MAG TPA: hypothetical protein VHU91_02975 [Mycobacteriales bacterium]|nr:hypothetical protein [Mycobacteriales bacterium]
MFILLLFNAFWLYVGCRLWIKVVRLQDRVDDVDGGYGSLRGDLSWLRERFGRSGRGRF